MYQPGRVLRCRSEEPIRTAYSLLCFAVPAANNFTFQEKTMKTLKQFSMTTLLIVMLTGLAFGGEIEIGKPSPPPPPSSSTVTAPGEIHIPGDIGIPGAQSDSVPEIALNLLLGALSLF